MNKPVVTYLIYALNEARFIHEAVQSALDQTYSPLEIVLSDDGSVDGTYEIMAEMARGYDGPHKIILNRNDKNLGIGSQINAAYLKGRGELIVLANGDDVSCADRVERIVAEWLMSKKSASGISSLLEVIGPSGEPTGRVMDTSNRFENFAVAAYNRFGGPAAASLAIRRDCFDHFGLLADHLIIEDGPLCMRATALGSWIFIKEPLVKYRVHEENISQVYYVEEFASWRPKHRQRTAWQRREGQKAALQMLSDLYSRAGDGNLRVDRRNVRAARRGATRRLLEDQLLEDAYSGEWSVPLWNWWLFVVHLAVLIWKISLRRMLPILETRNDRWHYRGVKNQPSASQTSPQSGTDPEPPNLPAGGGLGRDPLSGRQPLQRP